MVCGERFLVYLCPYAMAAEVDQDQSRTLWNQMAFYLTRRCFTSQSPIAYNESPLLTLPILCCETVGMTILLDAHLLHCNMDTLESVLISEVSRFQGLSCTQKWHLGGQKVFLFSECLQWRNSNVHLCTILISIAPVTW